MTLRSGFFLSAKALECLIIAITILLIFFLMTNGVPLIQLGLMQPLQSKMRYLAFHRILTPILILLCVLMARFYPNDFRQLWLVRKLLSLSNKKLIISASLLGVLYAFSSILTGFMRYAALETRAFDLGIFAQAVWNSLHGRLLFSSIKENICLLGDHMSPILLLLTPFYALWQDPRNLIIAQAIAMAACIPLIALIARYTLKDTAASLAFVLSWFFLSPPKAMLREDFHPEALAEPLLMAAFYFMICNRNKLWIFFCILAASAKENIWGIVFIMGFYKLWFQSQKCLGLTVMAFSVGLFLLSVKIFIPWIGNTRYLYEGFYLHLMKDPSKLLAVVLSYDTWEYVFKSFAPFGFISFFAPATLILTVPVLVQNCLSQNPVFRSLSYHYTAGLTPFIILSAIFGLKRLVLFLKGDATRLRITAFFMLGVLIMQSGHSEYYYSWKSASNITPKKQMIIQRLRDIPSDAVVLTHNCLIPQLAHRPFIYQFEHNASPTKRESAVNRNADLVILDRDFMEPNTLGLNESIAELIAANYTIQYEQDGFYIFRKGDL